jgi:hypothetical protein
MASDHELYAEYLAFYCESALGDKERIAGDDYSVAEDPKKAAVCALAVCHMLARRSPMTLAEVTQEIRRLFGEESEAAG